MNRLKCHLLQLVLSNWFWFTFSSPGSDTVTESVSDDDSERDAEEDDFSDNDLEMLKKRRHWATQYPMGARELGRWICCWTGHIHGATSIRLVKALCWYGQVSEWHTVCFHFGTICQWYTSSNTFDLSDWWKSKCVTLPGFTYVLCAVLTNSPNSCPSESLFRIFNATYNDDLKKSHTDYIELSIQVQFNKRSLQ